MSLMKLVHGQRADRWLSPQMDPEVPYRISPGQWSIQLPPRRIVTHPTQQRQRRKLKAGETVIIEAAGTLQPKLCVAKLVVNPALIALGHITMCDMHEEGTRFRPSLRFTPEEELDLDDLFGDYTGVEPGSWLLAVYADIKY